MSNLNSNLEVLFSKMENFITTKTVVGEPINVGDVIILPLVDVTFGVGAGSSSCADDKNNKEDGGGGLGGKISPSAVVVIQNGSVQLVNVKNQNSMDKLIDMVPGIVSKFNFGEMFNKDKKTENDINKKDEQEIFDDEK